MADNKREILSAALSAHISELRLFWRETGLSCRWLVPDAEHCYVDEEAVKYLKKFKETAAEKIVNKGVFDQWNEKSAPILETEDAGMTPFPLRTLTWLLRVMESPHRDDLSTDSWNLYLWSVRLHDLPNRIMRRLSNYLEMPDKQAILDFDTLASQYTQILEGVYPKDDSQMEDLDRMTLCKRFDRLRRFKNLIFYGVANIGKANISKELISNWKAMTGREIGLHCVTVFHSNLNYGDLVERRIPTAFVSNHTPIDHCTPRVLADHIGDGKYFFEPLNNENIQEGLLLSLCRAAAYNPDKDFVFMVDCIDAIHLEKVLGEVSHMLDSFARVPWKIDENGVGAWNLEAPGARTIRLSQSGRIFFVPSNVYILGTANESGLFDGEVDDHLFQTFAIEYLQPKSTEELRATMLNHRSHEAFARLEEYANFSVELWAKINSILIQTGGHKNVIGYGPLLSMCEEILQSGDVLEANRMVLGTWRYRMMPPIRAKMEALLHGSTTHRAALNTLIEVLNTSWLRMHVAVEGMPGSEALHMTFEPEM